MTFSEFDSILQEGPIESFLSIIESNANGLDGGQVFEPRASLRGRYTYPDCLLCVGQHEVGPPPATDCNCYKPDARIAC